MVLGGWRALRVYEQWSRYAAHNCRQLYQSVQVSLSYLQLPLIKWLKKNTHNNRLIDLASLFQNF
jgi:hypothetical protein